MLGEELVLRFFIIQKYGYDKRVTDYMDFSVDKKYEEIKKDFRDKKIIRLYQNQFKNMIRRVTSLFSDNSFQVLKKGIEGNKKERWDAFVFSDALNQGLYHLFSYYLPKYSEHQFNRANKTKVKTGFLELLKNKHFVEMITGAGTNRPYNIKESKEIFEKKFLLRYLGNWTKREERNITGPEKRTLAKKANFQICCLPMEHATTKKELKT